MTQAPKKKLPEIEQQFKTPKREVRVPESDLLDAISKRNHFHVTMPADTTQAKIGEPLTWTHGAKKMKEGDEITVVADDGSFYSRWLVLYADRLQAQLHCLEWQEIGESKLIETPDDRVFVKHFVNRDIRWAVIRKVDGVRIAEGLATKEEALAWVVKNQVRMAA